MASLFHMTTLVTWEKYATRSSDVVVLWNIDPQSSLPPSSSWNRATKRLNSGLRLKIKLLLSKKNYKVDWKLKLSYALKNARIGVVRLSLKGNRNLPVSEQLFTYPSPNPTLTLTWLLLGLGEELLPSASDTNIALKHHVIHFLRYSWRKRRHE